MPITSYFKRYTINCIALQILLWFAIYPAASFAQLPINQQPMYGDLSKNEEYLAVDKQFISTETQRFGNRAAAAQQYVNFGWGYLNAGNVTTAIRRFNQAWLLDSTAADIYFGFSAYLRKQGKVGEAERFMKLGKRHDIDNKSLMRYYGSISQGQENQRDYAGAIATYKQMLQVDANSTYANKKLGYFYINQDTARANYHLTRALQVDFQDTVSYLNRGWLRYGQKRYSEAIADFTQAIRISPNYISAYNNRAMAYMDQGNLTAALVDLQKCLELVPPRDKGQFYRAIGMIKLQANDKAGACESLRQALQWGSDTPATDKEIRRLIKSNCS